MADDSAKPVENSELPKDVLAPAEGPRENLVATAVKFLQNPKVRQSPMYQKEAFLEKKGLTKEEIQLAVQRAGVSSDDSPPPQQQLQPPPPHLQHPAVYPNNGIVPSQHFVAPQPLPVSPWTRAREIATTTAIVAAVSYAVYNLFKTYIRPWLLGKSEAEDRLERLEANITALHESIAETNTQVLETLKGIQEALASQRDRNLQSTDLSLRQENRGLSEIKGEISSLKGLLLNRRQFPPPPITSPVVPAWQKTALQENKTEESAAKTPVSADLEGSGSVSASGSSSFASQPDLRTDDLAAQAKGEDTEVPPEKDTPPALHAGGELSNITPGDGSPTTQTDVDISASQSAMSNNGFEVVTTNRDSGDDGV